MSRNYSIARTTGTTCTRAFPNFSSGKQSTQQQREESLKGSPILPKAEHCLKSITNSHCIHSMYAIFAYIVVVSGVNVGKYSTHGVAHRNQGPSFGRWFSSIWTGTAGSSYEEFAWIPPLGSCVRLTWPLLALA